ncbi:MAG: class I SAM-dependent methyltransferase [Victivallales bacterium]
MLKDRADSKVVEKCQICSSEKLQSVLFLGYLPPVNKMRKIGERPKEESAYPAELLSCPDCGLVQLGLIVSPKILFPAEYPYTSSTTKILRDNFAELYTECSGILKLGKDDLVVDIGSNDGNLLSNFKDKHRVLGITPEDIGKIAIGRGIPTVLDYFRAESVEKVLKEYGRPSLVTATNVFAHIDDVNEIVSLIIGMLDKDGVFISESHYLLPLIEDLQFDTVYHEHLRYYSLHALKNLFERHGLEIFHAKRIPTHGGSIRVYTARKGMRKVGESVKKLMSAEKKVVTEKASLDKFRMDVEKAKLSMMKLLGGIFESGKKIYGISAPSRASTLINYCAIDDAVMECVLEIKGSHKIGYYVPGTLIPILEETKLFEDQPEYAMIFSWHIAEELIPKLKAKGFKGDFIVPLPVPRIIKNSQAG